MVVVGLLEGTYYLLYDNAVLHIPHIMVYMYDFYLGKVRKKERPTLKWSELQQ